MIRINIALRLPKEVENEAIQIATNIVKSKDHFFFVDGVTILPHVTLYAPVVNEENISNVLEALEKILKDTEQLFLTVKEISEGQGYVGIEFGLIPELRAMQDRIVTSIEPLMEKNVSEEFSEGKDYKMIFSQGGQQSLQKYGSVGVVNFHPHLTLLRMKNEIDGQFAKRKVKWSNHRFLVSKVGMYLMGKSGVCNELIEEFTLQSSL